MIEPKTELPGDEQYSVARVLASMVLGAAQNAPPQPGIERDTFLMQFAMSEPMLAGAIYAMVTQMATARFRLVGSEEDVAIAEQILGQSALGAGFASFISTVMFSALATDTGGWFEIVRPAIVRKSGKKAIRNSDGWADESGEAVDPESVEVIYPSLPITLIPLDPRRCIPTGDPGAPLRYLARDGREVILQWHQCGRIVDLPLPGSVYGWCAVSRVLAAVQLMSGILTWHNDRISGNMARMLVISSASPKAIEKALNDAAKSAVSSGNRLYVPPVFVHPMDPSATPAAEVIMLADLPPGFNFTDFWTIYITILAAGFGMDYGTLAPLPGSRLGTATEMEVQARLAQSKGPGYFLRQIAHIMNTRGILPKGVRFEFIATNWTEEEQIAKARLLRAQERAVRIKSGEIDERTARQIAADVGDLEPMYLTLYGERDLTPKKNESEEQSRTDIH
ncbi:hypothetical protein [Thermogutta sp.]|uniref:hypothetical protein n=1 Tax=Thermogutta sp. TaxID=1962930 RepID=UPI00321FF815